MGSITISEFKISEFDPSTLEAKAFIPNVGRVGLIRIMKSSRDQLTPTGQKEVPDTQNIWVVSSVGTSLEYQKQGVAKALYLAALKYVAPCILVMHEHTKSGETHFKAKKIWESLKKEEYLKTGNGWARLKNT